MNSLNYKAVRRAVILDRAEDGEPPPDRPKTRADCVNGERPCPFFCCRYNLSFDITFGGGLQHLFGTDDIDQMPAGNCALDFAEKGKMTLQEVGAALGVTRERVRQIEKMAMRKLAERLEQKGMEQWEWAMEATNG